MIIANLITLVPGIALTIIGGCGTIALLKENREAKKNIKDTEIIIGYEKIHGLKWPIIVDMRKTPHLLVCGLSNSGKTKMVEYAIRNKNAVVLNADFQKDFKSFNGQKISGIENTKEYLENLMSVDKPLEHPLYVVIDELLVLSNRKEINVVIMDLLAIARHKNIYIIGISQSGEKENLKYKHLFNTRVCFRMVEESSYRTVLGYSPEIKDLQQRQFLYYSDRTGMGYTYDVG